MQELGPMSAVAALYATDRPDLAEAIVASLSHAIFHGPEARPACGKKLFLGRVSQRVVRWTTRSSTSKDQAGDDVTLFRNRLMERSGHPYAQALLTSSCQKSAALVEGGDPMNGPYMMLSPEIRKNGGVWDRIFLDSVQAKDVQVRFIHETRATWQAAKRLLDRGESVRIKAVAAGTGLSLILVYDKLVKDGYDPKSITAVITDRDPANTEKSNRLLAKLSTTCHTHNLPGLAHGIIAVAEDVFEGPDPAMDALHGPYDIVTAIGILEYFQGGSHFTTEQRLMLHEPEEALSAGDLAAKLGELTTHGGNLIVNSYRDHASIQILEIFGKRFDFRERRHLLDLLAPLNFRSLHLAGSGHIYDVEVFEKAAQGS
jgi:hypothetical protein